MTDEVLYARDGCLGRIMLNRPKVINALTSQMVTSVLAQLEDWAQDDTVATVSIQGAGERGLCSGGDVRALRSNLVQGSAGAVQFWAHEYRMNAAISSYPKPFVAFMDGIVMGGGCRHLGSRQPAAGDRAFADRHARDRHRLLPRRRLALPALPRAW